MSIKNLAVIAEVDVAGIEVDVESDYDDHSLFGLKPIPPAGYTGFRLEIFVDTLAPGDKVRKLVNQALDTSMWYAVFAHAQPIESRITIGCGDREQEE